MTDETEPILGLSWIFGFFMVLFPEEIIQLIFLTLFSLTTPAQGFFIFIFYCLNLKVTLQFFTRSCFSLIPLFTLYRLWANMLALLDMSFRTSNGGRTWSHVVQRHLAAQPLLHAIPPAQVVLIVLHALSTRPQRTLPAWTILPREPRQGTSASPWHAFTAADEINSFFV